MRAQLTNPWFDIFKLTTRDGIVRYTLMNRCGTTGTLLVDTDRCSVVLRHGDVQWMWERLRSAQDVADAIIHYIMTGTLVPCLTQNADGDREPGNGTTTNTRTTGRAA